MNPILIVEDDHGLNRAICYAAAKEGYEPLPAFTLKQAEDLFTKHKIELVLLDVNLPDGEGFAFCRQIKKQSRTPVLFLTARDLEEDALAGYELGADDYITKPFSMKILFKKINVILNRSIQPENKMDFDDGFLKVDYERAQVSAGGKPAALTPTELRLIGQFLAHRTQLLTYDFLLERLWDSGGQFVDKHTLAVNINRLRGKIENSNHKYISNVYGMGYQWIGS